MGLYPTAELIFGVPILARDENTYEPTEWWDEDNEDWRDDFERLAIVPYGHYEDPDPKAILSVKEAEVFRADAWEPTVVEAFHFPLSVRPKAISKANEELRALGLPADMHDAQWYLVASYG